jgi:hypothetical protein
MGQPYHRIEFVEERDGDREVVAGVTVAWTGGDSPGHHRLRRGELRSRDHHRRPRSFTGNRASTYKCRSASGTRRHVLPTHDPEVLVEYPDWIHWSVRIGRGQRDPHVPGLKSRTWSSTTHHIER